MLTVDRWFRRLMQPRLSRHGSWALLGIVLVGSYVLEVGLGGADHFEPLWVLFAIAYAAWRLGGRATAVAVALSVVLMGPLMPSDVRTGAPQELEDWTSRAFFFLFLGALLTYLFGQFRRTVALVEAERDAALAKQLIEHRAQDLERAISEGQLHLHYQPIVSATNSELIGLEALARWNHPVRGAVSPDEFVALAEQAGIVQQLDTWVVRTATREAADWQAIHPVRLGINLSSVTVSNAAAVADVERAILDSGLDPGLIDLEMTETAMAGDPEIAAASLNRLAALGARLSLDDFGMGYGVLERLRSYPFSTVKIDRSFIAGVTGRDGPMVEAIVRMAQTLGIEVVAEGVEEPEQLAILRIMGVAQIQGFLVSRPLPPAEVRRLLTAAADLVGAAGRVA